jgi:hypothetical protein
MTWRSRRERSDGVGTVIGSESRGYADKSTLLIIQHTATEVNGRRVDLAELFGGTDRGRKRDRPAERMPQRVCKSKLEDNFQVGTAGFEPATP